MEVIPRTQLKHDSWQTLLSSKVALSTQHLCHTLLQHQRPCGFRPMKPLEEIGVVDRQGQLWKKKAFKMWLPMKDIHFCNIHKLLKKNTTII